MIGAALKSALVTRRAEYNARFAAARRQHRTLDPAAFQSWLADTVDPVAEAIAQSAAPGLDASIDALYEIGLGLVALGWLGPAARQPALAVAWRDYLLAIVPRLGEAPARLAGSGWNALWQLSTQPAVSLTAWVEVVSRGAPHCKDADALLDLGRLAAWRAGAAQHRTAALDAALRLPPAALAASLQLPRPLPRESWHSMAREPATVPEDWLTGGSIDLSPLGWIGGFTGYGGPFQRPPRLELATGRIIVREGGRRWTLHADGYGSAFLPAAANAPATQAPLPPRVRVVTGKVGADGTALTDTQLVDPVDKVAAGGVLAVSLRHSFRIGLYRLPVTLERVR
jgi:hypothetical protein